jgi:hypothetical protein
MSRVREKRRRCAPHPEVREKHKGCAPHPEGWVLVKHLQILEVNMVYSYKNVSFIFENFIFRKFCKNWCTKYRLERKIKI